MNPTQVCPRCGARPAARDGHPDAADRALSRIDEEARRLHERALTPAAWSEEQRIEELTREVQELRETVARLRGAASAAAGYR